ncbi:MAG TPA: FliA/WhiG family RNA polymerase sigma factor [Aquificae bacterium]|nr:FliA/WhiG family RNA polymerase sigma factor [Aquificota bacterium]
MSKYSNVYEEVKIDKKKDLVIKYLPLVKSIAYKIYKKLPNGVVDFDELVNTGVLGLLDAIEKFDKKKGNLGTYAYIRIRGEILDFLRKLDWLPKNQREKVKELQKKFSNYYQNNEELPDEEVLADMLSTDVDNVKKLLALSEVNNMISLEEIINPELNQTLKDILPDNSLTPEEITIKESLKKCLKEALKKLSEREQLILQLVYVEELKVEDIAKILNISISRVSQIKHQALKKLRKFLSKEIGEKL